MKRGYWIAGGVAGLLGLVLLSKPSKPPVNKPSGKIVINVTERAKKFVKERLADALDLQKKYGIPYLFSLAQWGLESGWGASAPGYNFFGIKATPAWKGKTQLLDTTEYVDGKKVKVKRSFRAYGSWAAAVEDWSKIIRLPRYKAAFRHKSDPRMFATEIKNGGYATSPTYDKVIISLIDKIELEIKKEVKK